MGLTARHWSKIYNSKSLVGGFTLIEIIIVTVLLGIVAYLGTYIIVPVIEGYVDMQVKTLLFNEAQYATSRMAKELRNAIPNTVKVLDSHTVEFVEFGGVGYYSPLQNSDNITHSGLNLAVGDNVSIYNTRPEDFYKGTRVYTVREIENGRSILNKDIAKDSPYHRIYKIGQLVAFYFKNGKIYRNSDFGISATADEIRNGGYVLASYVDNLTFTYKPGYTYRQAILIIKLVMKKNNVEINYNEEVHIRNVP